MKYVRLYSLIIIYDWLKQFVVIPSFKENTTEIMYFEPRIVKIVKGDSITWINRDTKVHNLISGDANSSLQSPFFQTGSMLPGESTSVKIDSNQQSIPYYCSIHPSERGVIAIFPIPEDQMTEQDLSLIHIWRCRRSTLCRSRWSPYH